jgi:hypothetical protein
MAGLVKHTSEALKRAAPFSGPGVRNVTSPMFLLGPIAKNALTGWKIVM